MSTDMIGTEQWWCACGNQTSEWFSRTYRDVELHAGRPDPGYICPLCAGFRDGMREGVREGDKKVEPWWRTAKVA